MLASTSWLPLTETERNLTNDIDYINLFDLGISRAKQTLTIVNSHTAYCQSLVTGRLRLIKCYDIGWPSDTELEC